MSGSTIKLLMVEDNPSDAVMLRVTLAEASDDYELVHVDRLAKGLERLSAGDIALAFLDLTLPDSRGLETVTRVRTGAPELPIVVLSSLDDEELAIKSVQEGAQNYLVKWRFSARLLTRAIVSAIEQKRSLVSLERQLQQLRSRDALLRSVTDNTSDGLLVVDQQSAICFANPAAVSLLGRSEEELLGSPFRLLPEPGERAEIETVGGEGRRVRLEVRTAPTQWDSASAYLVLLREKER